jgi:peptide/nickel transport system substrate-binding protein
VTRLTRASARRSSRPLRGPLLIITRLSALVLLFAACTAAPAASAPPASGTLTPTGGTVRVAIPDDIASLDPWTSPDPTSQLVLRQVFETLVDLEPGGFRVVPKLAEKWTVSGDGRAWTFSLRGNVQFHDGTAFDAGAVAANFERGLGFARFGLASVVASVTAPTPSSVVFNLKAPFAPLLATLASPSFGIVSPACLKQGPSWFSPASQCAAGTGPFRIVAGAWKPGDRITLARTASYWGFDATGKRLPLADSLVFRVSGIEDARTGSLRNASADVATELAPQSVRLLRSDPNLATLSRPPFESAYLGITTGAAPLDAPDVRRALAMAIDRAAIVRTSYVGSARAASQLVPPLLLGYDDTVAQFTATDASAAKKLLADAGFPQGFATELWYAPDFSVALPDPKAIADAVAADLARIGITATVRAAGPDTFAAAARAGMFPLWLGARAPARADADDFLSDATPSTVAQELLRRARAESDTSKRAELYKQVSKMIQQDVTRIPLVVAGGSLGATRKVQGLVPQPVVGESFAAVSVGR